MANFDALVDDFLANEYEISPVLATTLGLTDYDERLDNLSASAWHRRASDAETWLKRFENADPSTPSSDDEIDRQLGVAMMRGRMIHADWYAWKRDPTLYSGPILNGLFYLFLNRLRPTADLVD